MRDNKDRFTPQVLHDARARELYNTKTWIHSSLTANFRKIYWNRVVCVLNCIHKIEFTKMMVIPRSIVSVHHTALFLLFKVIRIRLCCSFVHSPSASSNLGREYSSQEYTQLLITTTNPLLANYLKFWIRFNTFWIFTHSLQVISFNEMNLYRCIFCMRSIDSFYLNYKFASL